MLRPTKHSHPDQTVIAVAMSLLRKLRADRVCSYKTLRDLTKKYCDGTDVLFLPCLNFLFLLGLIEYRQKNDLIEYAGPNETV